MSSSALVLGKTPASKEALLKDLQAAYLDNLVTSLKEPWKVQNIVSGVGPFGEVVSKVLDALHKTLCSYFKEKQPFLLGSGASSKFLN